MLQDYYNVAHVSLCFCHTFLAFEKVKIGEVMGILDEEQKQLYGFLSFHASCI